MIGSILVILCGLTSVGLLLYSLYGSGYTIVLLLTNGERKTIPATRFSVPTTDDIDKAEWETRTPESPRGAIVYGWYRVKQ